ncbi:MAG: glycoside hydrolase family 15 protein [Chloroflexi bacterium]|nr:glycoside hydrolase family 15 protein [Chloroflexota bacterium]
MRPDLYEHSISVIRRNQHPSGAYIASPNLGHYRYAWFRDGAFISYAMDLVGEHDSSRRFHEWASQAVIRYEQKIRRSTQRAIQGTVPSREEFLHCRLTAEWLEVKGEWANHQLDGLGTWLWALAEHIRITEASVLPEAWAKAASLVGDYLSALWRFPCSDAWEENGEEIHTYTLASVYAGLRAVAEWTHQEGAERTAEEIRSFVIANAIEDGHLVKYIGSPEVDASLVGVATPYGLLAVDDPLMRSTVACIVEDLRSPSGGVRRYRADTFYGGGEWILLTCWLGWHYAASGQLDEAERILAWAEEQATVQGDLPEQAAVNLIAPTCYPGWVEKWGPIATPLLWSHGMYLILWQVTATDHLSRESRSRGHGGD